MTTLADRPGTKNMLQFPDAGESGEVQGRSLPSIGSGIHGKHFGATLDQLACLTTGRSKRVTPPAPAQAESHIGVLHSEMSMI
jgi:hypothetical protein